jgi:hypothetical protein
VSRVANWDTGGSPIPNPYYTIYILSGSSFSSKSDNVVHRAMGHKRGVHWAHSTIIGSTETISTPTSIAAGAQLSRASAGVKIPPLPI